MIPEKIKKAFLNDLQVKEELINPNPNDWKSKKKFIDSLINSRVQKNIQEAPEDYPVHRLVSPNIAKEEVLKNTIDKPFRFISSKAFVDNWNDDKRKLNDVNKFVLLTFLNIPAKHWNKFLNDEIQLETETETYFRGFYYNEYMHLRSTVLIIDKSWKTAKMKSINFNDEITIAEGAILLLDNTYLIQFLDESKLLTIFFPVNGKKGNIVESSYLHKYHRTGNYNSGKVIWEIISESQVKENLSLVTTNSIPFEITNELAFNQLTMRNQTYNSYKDMPSANAAYKFTRYAGVYNVYVSAFQRNSIDLFAVKISKDGDIEVITPFNKYTGIAKIIGNENILEFKFNYDANMFKYRMFIYMHLNTISEIWHNGTISGIDFQNYSLSSKIIAHKTGKKNIDEIKVGTWKLTSENLFDNNIFPVEVVQFFLESANNIVKSYEALNEMAIIAGYSTYLETRRTDISSMAGVYFVFGLNNWSMTQCIRKAILKITDKGEISLKIKEFNYTGKAEINDDILIISAHQDNDKRIFGTNYFFIGAYRRVNIEHCFGIYMGKNHNLSIEALRTILVKTDEKYSELTPENITINSPKFNDLNKKYNGLATFLTGEAGNMILSDNKVNSLFDKKTNYGQIYFCAACFAACNQNKIQLIEMLKKAKNNGFDNFVLLTKEIENGCLKNYKQEVENVFKNQIFYKYKQKT